MGTLLCISSLLLVSLLPAHGPCNAEQALSTRASLR